MQKSKEKLGVAQHKGPHFPGEMCKGFYQPVPSLWIILAIKSPNACTERFVCQLVEPFARQIQAKTSVRMQSVRGIGAISLAI